MNLGSQKIFDSHRAVTLKQPGNLPMPAPRRPRQRSGHGGSSGRLGLITEHEPDERLTDGAAERTGIVRQRWIDGEDLGGCL